uniref:Uncharacterized protein n=1 Tax=Oryza barthii TaxID=65489 RepID=A0A0D3F258_9ORYZ
MAETEAAGHRRSPELGSVEASLPLLPLPSFPSGGAPKALRATGGKLEHGPPAVDLEHGPRGRGLRAADSSPGQRRQWPLSQLLPDLAGGKLDETNSRVGEWGSVLVARWVLWRRPDSTVEMGRRLATARSRSGSNRACLWQWRRDAAVGLGGLADSNGAGRGWLPCPDSRGGTSAAGGQRHLNLMGLVVFGSSDPATSAEQQ